MILFSAHAEVQIVKRALDRVWIEATIVRPDWTVADAEPHVTRSFKAIAAFGGRVLRVVHRPDGTDVFVISVYFDRGARR